MVFYDATSSAMVCFTQDFPGKKVGFGGLLSSMVFGGLLSSRGFVLGIKNQDSDSGHDLTKHSS
jgi:hypothetical protein